MRDEIVARLGDIEREESVAVIYACESGSRAWGFPSENSDYDVRFLYVRAPEWYFSIDVEDRRDVIERPIDDMLDISGWDIRKGLRLMRKSNPPLLEWLDSPIVYSVDAPLLALLAELIPIYYDPTSCAYHYLSMARGNAQNYLRGETILLKKYLYVLRPLLAVRWIEAGYGAVPMEFGRLLDRCVSDATVREAIDRLIERKRGGLESVREPRIEAISRFIEEELQRHEGKPFRFDRRMNGPEEMNRVFRAIVGAVADRRSRVR